MFLPVQSGGDEPEGSTPLVQKQSPAAILKNGHKPMENRLNPRYNLEG